MLNKILLRIAQSLMLCESEIQSKNMMNTCSPVHHHSWAAWRPTRHQGQLILMHTSKIRLR